MTRGGVIGDPTFDLTSQPWLRVRTRDSRVTEVSLRDLFDHAHEYVCLAGDVPTQDVALLRLALAILRRSHPDMQTPEDWKRLWEIGRFDLTPIAAYLDAHRSRFDLLQPSQPFFQVADLRTAKGDLTDLARLVPDVPAGHQYFTTRAGRSLTSMSFAEAARWVVHAQAWDASGIKSGAVGDDRVTGGKGYPIGVAWCGWLGIVVAEGADLFQTLLLNCPPGGATDLEQDKPVWERDPQGPGVDERPGAPFGPVDLLTWQSRRIRLGHDGERVTGVLIANGDALHPRDRFRAEFMTSWRLSEAQMKALKSADPVYMPRQHQPGRAVWRGLEGLLAATSGITRTRSGRWRDWLATLVQHGALPRSFPVRLHVTGTAYGSQSSVIDDILDDRLTLSAAVLADPVLKGLAVAAVEDVDTTARALTTLAADLIRAAGGDRELEATARGAAREDFYHLADAPYRRWLRRVGTDTDADDARVAWQLELRGLAASSARALVDGAGDRAWSGLPAGPERKRPLNAATAKGWFDRNLRAALPYGYPPPEGRAS